MKEQLYNKYNLNKEDEDFLDKIIDPIYTHKEFQKRCTSDFFHHSDITLGEHIISDAIMTYILSKKYLKKHKNSNYDLSLAVIIAMLHDLYTIPWQNNKPNSKVNNFFNKHGFRHPLEAVINAYTWYPNLFKNNESNNVLIDGIIHHMYPLPVKRFDKNNIQNMELKNEALVKDIPDNTLDILVESTNRGKLFNISIAKSKYKEGRIMSKADRCVSRGQILNFCSALALITGTNKSLKK